MQAYAFNQPHIAAQCRKLNHGRHFYDICVALNLSPLHRGNGQTVQNTSFLRESPTVLHAVVLQKLGHEAESAALHATCETS
jgi:hypothetical protein